MTFEILFYAAVAVIYVALGVALWRENTKPRDHL